MTSTERLEEVVLQELDSARDTLKVVDHDLDKLLGRDPTAPRPIRRRVVAPQWTEDKEEFGAPTEFHTGRGRRRLDRGPPRDRDHQHPAHGRDNQHPVHGRDHQHPAHGRDHQHPVHGRDHQHSAHGRDHQHPTHVVRRGASSAAGRGGVTVIGPRLRRRADSGDDGDTPALQSHVIPPFEVSAEDTKSRQLALEQRKDDKENINRSRRMFGALLGTLQRFRNDQVKQKDKVDKRAEIERRLDQAARREKVELQQRKVEMLAARKRKQQEVKLIEMKAIKVREEKEWEQYQRQLMNFARTDCRPHIYFQPKLCHPATDAQLVHTQRLIADDIEAHRTRLREELSLLDSRLERLQKMADMESGADNGRRGGAGGRHGSVERQPVADAAGDGGEDEEGLSSDVGDSSGDSPGRDRPVGSVVVPAGGGVGERAGKRDACVRERPAIDDPALYTETRGVGRQPGDHRVDRGDDGMEKGNGGVDRGGNRVDCGDDRGGRDDDMAERGNGWVDNQVGGEHGHSTDASNGRHSGELVRLDDADKTVQTAQNGASKRSSEDNFDRTPSDMLPLNVRVKVEKDCPMTAIDKQYSTTSVDSVRVKQENPDLAGMASKAKEIPPVIELATDSFLKGRERNTAEHRADRGVDESQGGTGANLGESAAVGEVVSISTGTYSNTDDQQLGVEEVGPSSRKVSRRQRSAVVADVGSPRSEDPDVPSISKLPEVDRQSGHSKRRKNYSETDNTTIDPYDDAGNAHSVPREVGKQVSGETGGENLHSKKGDEEACFLARGGGTEELSGRFDLRESLGVDTGSNLPKARKSVEGIGSHRIEPVESREGFINYKSRELGESHSGSKRSKPSDPGEGDSGSKRSKTVSRAGESGETDPGSDPREPREVGRGAKRSKHGESGVGSKRKSRELEEEVPRQSKDCESDKGFKRSKTGELGETPSSDGQAKVSKCSEAPSVAKNHRSRSRRSESPVRRVKHSADAKSTPRSSERTSRGELDRSGKGRSDQCRSSSSRHRDDAGANNSDRNEKDGHRRSRSKNSASDRAASRSDRGKDVGSRRRADGDRPVSSKGSSSQHKRHGVDRSRRRTPDTSDSSSDSSSSSGSSSSSASQSD